MQNDWMMESRQRQWPQSTRRGYKSSPVIFVNIYNIMVKYEKIGATWMSILPWNTESYESGTLCVMDVERQPNSGSLVILSCVFISITILLKAGISIDPLLYAWPFAHHSFSIVIYLWRGFCSSPSEAPEAWSGFYLSSREASPGRDGAEVLPLPAGPRPYPNPIQEEQWGNRVIYWAPKPCSQRFWPWPSQLAGVLNLGPIDPQGCIKLSEENVFTFINT